MEHKVGDLLSVEQGIILHQVNCQGKMNSGVAKAIREKWPVVFEEYLDHCHSGVVAEDVLGTAQVIKVGTDLWVANLFGQLNYGYDGRRYTSYDALDSGLAAVAAWMFENNFTSADAHHPLLGSDRGGACWGVVAALIKHRIGDRTTLWTLPFQERV